MSFPGAESSPGIWTGHQPHFPPHSDPTGQKGEGTSIHSPGRTWCAKTPGIHHAGEGHQNSQVME